MSENICWFCKENAAGKEYEIKKIMYDPKSRVGGIGQRAKYTGAEIRIPCCQECNAKTNTVKIYAGLYMAFLVVFTILSGIVGYLIETNMDIYNLSVYFGVGGFVIGLLMAYPFIKLFGPKIGGGTQNWSSYPEVQERIKNGWVIGKPPV